MSVDLELFVCNSKRMRRKYFCQNPAKDSFGQLIRLRSVWVGAFGRWYEETGGNESRYINPAISRIWDIFGGEYLDSKITDKLIAQVKDAFNLPITADRFYSLNDADEVIDFLEQNRGKRAFYVDM